MEESSFGTKKWLFGHFRVVAENNFIPTKNSNSLGYFTLKLGTTFGGGKIKML